MARKEFIADATRQRKHRALGAPRRRGDSEGRTRVQPLSLSLASKQTASNLSGASAQLEGVVATFASADVQAIAQRGAAVACELHFSGRGFASIGLGFGIRKEQQRWCASRDRQRAWTPSGRRSERELPLHLRPELTPPRRAEKPPPRGDGHPLGNLLRYLLVRRTPETRPAAPPAARRPCSRWYPSPPSRRCPPPRRSTASTSPRAPRARRRIVTETVLLVSPATNVSVPEAAV